MTESNNVAPINQAADFESAYAEWRETVSSKYNDQSFITRNRSGLELEPVYAGYGQQDSGVEMPGQYPYTRGIYPIHYQHQPWMDLQIIGYGLPSQTRERMDLLLQEGGAKGYFDREAYNFIFDMPTSMGLDPDHPGVGGSIGDCGISVCKTSDYEILLAGKDLEKTTVSMVLNAGSPAMLGLYLAAAKRRGFAFDKLSGNLTNYIWDFFGHSGGTNFSPRGSYRLIADIAAYCAQYVPRWNTLTISEHNICEAGANNVQAVAYSIAAIIAVNEECKGLGIDLDSVVPRFGFHVRYGENFFEEIAKTRALRRVYAKVNRERFQCKKSSSLQARIHAQTAGSLLTAQQPMNNLVRNSYGSLAAVLSGVNGMTINGYDEALGLPTEEAVTLSLRTSQIIAEETGVIHVSDPMGGSYYVEALTDDIERQVFDIIEDIDSRGGLIACIESGWIKQQVSAAAYEWRKEVESGTRIMVGINKYKTDEPDQYNVFQPDPEAARMAISEVQRHRVERDNDKCTAALEALRQAANNVHRGLMIGSVMENLVAAAYADATLGEMQAVLHEVFGINK
jgi:methylmalonyl-CoA mutase N-terminal domain/subunit